MGVRKNELPGFNRGFSIRYRNDYVVSIHVYPDDDTEVSVNYDGDIPLVLRPDESHGDEYSTGLISVEKVTHIMYKVSLASSPIHFFMGGLLCNRVLDPANEVSKEELTRQIRDIING